jgi:hypothetical protein
MIAAAFGAGTVASGATRYVCAFGLGVAFNTTEANTFCPMATAGTVTAFYCQTSTAQSGTGTLVVTLRKTVNSGPTTTDSSTFTIGTSAGAGVFSDTSTTTSFNAGDSFNVKFVNNASATSAGIIGCSIAYKSQ